MLSQLEVACRQFEEIRKRDHGGAVGFVARELAGWLTKDVVPVVAQLIRRRDFQEQARWSLEHLVAGSKADVRRQIEATDGAIVKHAAALAALAALPAVQERLAQLTPLPGEPSSTDGMPAGLAAVQTISRRPWHDLAAGRDFFAREAGLNLVPIPGQRPPQFVDFVPGFDVYLRLPGDYVADMVLRRVKFWCESLHPIYVRWRGVATGPLGSEPSFQEVQKTVVSLNEHHEELQGMLTGPAAAQREACAALVQVYAEYCPKPELQWLNLPRGSSMRGHLQHWLAQHSEIAIADRIAGALARVAQGGGRQRTLAEKLQDAAQKHTLVLGAEPGHRYLFWKNEPVKGPWNQAALWDTLCALVLKAKRGETIDRFDVGPKVTKHALACRITRLKNVLPRELAARISDAGRGTYSLDVPADEIYPLDIDEALSLSVALSQKT